MCKATPGWQEQHNWWHCCCNNNWDASTRQVGTPSGFGKIPPTFPLLPDTGMPFNNGFELFWDGVRWHGTQRDGLTNMPLTGIKVL